MPKLKRRTKKSLEQKIPYARGFKPPTAKQRLHAVTGVSRGIDEPKGEFTDTPGNDFFPLIPEPSSIDDWLAQYNEEGQTYLKFIKECPWISRRKMKFFKGTFEPAGTTLTERYPQSKIYLLPVGEFDASTSPNFSDLANYAERFFQLPVEVLLNVQLCVDTSKREVLWVSNSEATTTWTDSNGDGGTKRRRRRSSRVFRQTIEARFHQASGHYQLRGRSVLYEVQKMMPRDALCLMALTMSDIYDEPSDLFVAGLAAGNHRVGIFSLKRYNPYLTFSTEHWYQISEENSEVTNQQQKAGIVLQRSSKLLVHEVAHLLGLDHCIWYSCCMNGSGHLSEDFLQSMHLCPVDLRKLQRLCGFGVVQRYQRLGEFFKMHGLAKEEDWIQRRIRYILDSPTK